jgi:hypothetical protein
MALDNTITQTQIQSVGLSSNVVLTGITTVGVLSASNAVISGVLTASNISVSNLTGTVSGTVTGSLNSNLVSTVGGLISTSQVTLTQTPFFRNVPVIASDYNVSTTYNEMSIGPITIQTGVTVTVNSGATWTVV